MPSLRLFSPVLVQKLLDHLASLGHERIDCFNVAPEDPVISAIVSQWNIWRAAHGMRGELIHAPVPPYTESLKVAYDVMSRRLRKKEFNSTAIFCTTERVAAGAIALADAGLKPGKDVAVCTLDCAGRADFSIPSLTSLSSPDPKPYLSVCLEWMTAGVHRRWQGPLLVQPEEVELAIRQSTVPDIDQTLIPSRVLGAQAMD